MIVTIHQPEYLPWIGFFDRIIKADVFVILDHVQYQKHGYINRNHIKTANGAEWLTIPVNKTLKQAPISKVEIRNNEDWQSKHYKSIIQNYSKAPYFKQYHDFIKKTYSTSWEYISDLDTHLITELLKQLNIKRPIHKSSEMDIEGESTDMLINICKRLKADTYLSGEGGKNYMDCDKFKEAGINVLFQSFTHPNYSQLHEKTGFLSHLSLIDLLFNHGENSLEIINNKSIA